MTGRCNSERIHLLAAISHGMAAQSESGAAEVRVHALLNAHAHKRRHALRLWQSIEQRTHRLRGACGLP